MKRIVLALLSGAALSWPAMVAPALAEDVTINLDALGKAEPAKPVVKSPPLRPDAVRSEIVADDPVEEKPPAAKPRPKAKPAAAPVAAPDLVPPKPAVKAAAPKKPAAPAPGEIDFIAKTKRKSQPEAPASAQAAAPPAKPVASAPLTPPPDIALDPEPVSPPAAMALPSTPATPPAKPIVAPKLTVAPKPPAAVKVNAGALDTPSGAQAGRPTGTPLAAIAPDGALYIPKNVEALPQPVAAPSASAPAAEPDAEEIQPLTLPPGMPEAPPLPAAAAAPAQTVAAVTPAAAPVAASGANATLARASVLAGYATAAELKFEAGQDALTPASQASLDQLAQSFKAAGMRVQLAAYSGPPGNNSSDARRLSLKRALAVREYLAGQGVQKLMVNIAAFGGPALGATDRVDVMVRSDKLPDVSSN